MLWENVGGKMQKVSHSQINKTNLTIPKLSLYHVLQLTSTNFKIFWEREECKKLVTVYFT